MRRPNSTHPGRAHRVCVGALNKDTDRGLDRMLLAALLLLTGLLVAASAAAKTSSGVLAVDSIAWAVSEVNQSTSSQSWTGVPDMSISLKNKKVTLASLASASTYGISRRGR